MITALTAGAERNITSVGGKFIGLGRLVDAGIAVPDAWVIPVDATQDEKTRRDLIETELTRWWRERQVDHAEASWAVRSSAVAEDLEDASFAGVYDTILGVTTLEALRDAVIRCWKAIDDARAVTYRSAVTYRDDGGRDVPDANIALVLQRMVDADVSGVMLTTNPMDPFAAQVVIDASYGLGESIVSGLVEPDHIVLDDETGQIVATVIGSKESELRLGPDGPRRSQVAESQRQELSLTDEQIAELHDLARSVTATIGADRDLEWAFEGDQLRVLQDRPITGLPPRNPKNIWTRGFGDEYLAECMLPITRDLFWPWITGPNFSEMLDMAGFDGADYSDMIRDHNGYAYLSGEVVVAQLSVMAPSGRPEAVLDWFPPKFRQHLLDLPRDQRRGFLSLIAPFRDRGRGGPRVNLKALDSHAADVERTVVPWLRDDLTRLSLTELNRRRAIVDRLGNDHFRVIRWGMLYARMGHDLLPRLLNDWADDGGEGGGELYASIVSGLPGTHTAALNKEIHSMALTAAAGPMVDEIAAGADYQSLRLMNPDEHLWHDFDSFVERHGHRGASRDAGSPRWNEQPEVVFGLIAAQVANDLATPSPDEIERRAAVRRKAAETKALKAAGCGVQGPLRRAILGWVIRFTQRYTVFRENQRYYLDYLITQSRLLLLEYGRRLVDVGILGSVDDVFYLHGGEFIELTNAPTQATTEQETPLQAEGLAHRSPEQIKTLRDLIAERREQYLAHKDRLPPMYLYDGVPTDGEGASNDDESDLDDMTLSGLGAAAGVGRGQTRTVSSLADLAHVRAGDVLVAGNIDPGWTSVFPLLGGLVTETGGMLSHGAILAREYGVPTVTGVRDALTRLATGTSVEVDGGRGRVSVLQQGQSPGK